MKEYNPRSLQNLKPFTSTNQAKAYRGGRRSSRLKQYVKETNISLDDVRKVFLTLLFSMTYNEILEISKDETQPVIIAGLIKAFIQDCKRGSVQSLSMALTWIFGKPTQPVKMEVSDSDDITRLNHDQIEERIQELMKDYCDARGLEIVPKGFIAGREEGKKFDNLCIIGHHKKGSFNSP